MNELLTAKREAIALGLCGDYRARWDTAKDREDLVKIATDANGALFLADMAAFGWGLTPAYIAEHFSDYLGDKYQIQQNGYTCRLFADDRIEHTVDSTQTIILDCEGYIEVPENTVCTIVVSTKKPLSITSRGKCFLTIYEPLRNVQYFYSEDKDTNFKLTFVEQSEWAHRQTT